MGKSQLSGRRIRLMTLRNMRMPAYMSKEFTNAARAAINGDGYTMIVVARHYARACNRRTVTKADIEKATAVVRELRR